MDWHKIWYIELKAILISELWKRVGKKEDNQKPFVLNSLKCETENLSKHTYLEYPPVIFSDW